MVTATKEKKAASKGIKAPDATESKTEEIHLSLISANSAQSRGMGVLSRLKEQGHGVFEKEDMDKQPIWPMLFSDKPEEKAEALDLLVAHEPEIVDLANKVFETGQLQPIGVRVDEGEYDVIFGMRRALAMAYNFAKGRSTDTIEAKIYAQKFSKAQLKLLALQENADRQEESPIDKAMTYKELKDEEGLSAEQIGALVGWSGQSVRMYMKLLDKKLEDKRLKIHAGEISVAKALDLLEKRKKEDGAEPRQGKEGGGRFRLPSIKAIIKLLEMDHKPPKMDKEEWDLWTTEPVRRLMALRLGLRYEPFKPAVEKPAKKGKGKAETNGAATASKVFKMKRETAVKLLMVLGKTDSRTWKDDRIKSTLENIVNIAEPGQQVESEKLQAWLDKLLKSYKDGYSIELLSDK